MKKVYTLQFVGLADSGVGPRDPLQNPRGNHCLTSLGESSMGQHGGVGLGFARCPHVTLSANASGRATPSEAKVPGWEQLFQLDDDGSVYHCGTGLCVRQVECNGVPAYDLGQCAAPVKAKFNVWRSRAGRADVVTYQGVPLLGATGHCTACGPFLMRQVCHGRCDAEGNPPVGWTKNSTHATSPPEREITFFQPMPTQRPLCGTYVMPKTPSLWDGLAGEKLESWWYFNKYGDHPGYR